MEITVKPVYNDHPWDPKIMAVIHSWSLFRGHLYNKSSKGDLKLVVVGDRLSLFGVAVSSGLTVFASQRIKFANIDSSSQSYWVRILTKNAGRGLQECQINSLKLGFECYGEKN